jgi:hypothetical protein
MNFLLLPVLGALAFVFGRNARKGVTTGVVWVNSTQLFRDKEPVLFWFGVGFSIALAAAMVAGIGIGLYTLVDLRS